MNVLTISDLHHPFANKQALAFLRKLKAKYKPDKVVCLGDEIDAHAMSQFSKEPDAPGADDELGRAIKNLRPLYDLFPNVLVCNSNHPARIWKRAAEKGIPSRCLQPMRVIIDAPKEWVWADQHAVGGVLFNHGDGFSGRNAALDAAITWRQSCVIAHVHAWAGVQWSAGPRNRIFGMNAGCLVDPDAPAFRYAKHNRHRSMLGTGVVLDGIPHFIPLS